jgi:exopolysaccharide biosynthesis polyprenyl glycosylphosphotransferase
VGGEELSTGHLTWPAAGDADRSDRDEPAEALEAELIALAASAANGSVRAAGVETGARKRTRSATVRRALVFADLAGLALAFGTVQAFISASTQHDLAISLTFLAALPAWLALAHVYGLYHDDDARVARSVADDFGGIVLLSTLATWLGLLTVNTSGLAHPKLQVAGGFWLGSIALITAARAIGRSIVYRLLAPQERTVVVGTGKVARRIAEKLGGRPEYGLQVVGFLDDEPLELPDDAPPYLGELSRLELLVHAHGIERVIVAFSKHPAEAHVELLRRCAGMGVRVDIIPRLFEVIGSRSVFHDVGGVPLVSVKAPRLSKPARLLKRTMDVALAGIALVLLAPFFALAAFCIKRESPGPVFFRQERMGAGGKTFRIFKFRSMCVDADERKDEIGHLNIHRENGPRMFKVPDDPRITRFGNFLRKWSLDELPQLINVVRGEMSLVGPRPLILGEDEHIHGHKRRRLHITPGLTGLWQVLGRSDIPFSEMVTLDYIYVLNWSLWGDVKLLVRTMPVVLAKRGAY